MADARPDTGHLTRQLGLLGLAATGICSMMGAAINVIPIAVQRNIPGIGPYVLLAYALAAIPAIFAALSMASLASAMPRAGGSYVFASRALHPYLGFVASFSQWFGLSIAIGVVSYLIVPFLRDIAAATGASALADALELGGVRVAIAMAFLWGFVFVNVRGLRLYERVLLPLMVLMFLGGGVVLVAGTLFDQTDFLAAVAAREGAAPSPPVAPASPSVAQILAASVVLFSSFIGFDSIAQAGGEARRPERNLPLAIGIALLTVGTFYLLFTASLYRVVPWWFMLERSAETDLTAPGLMGYLLPTGWTVAIIAGAAIALVNDLPAMLLAVSRLVFAWAEDGVFPRWVAAVHPRHHTPHRALVLSAATASLAIFGSHLAGDFFLGVDLLTTALAVTFLLMCLSTAMLDRRNPELARNVLFLRSRTSRLVVGVTGSALLSLYLGAHVMKDLTTDHPRWYYHATWTWLLVMGAATVLFAIEWRRLRAAGGDLHRKFSQLPPE